MKVRVGVGVVLAAAVVGGLAGCAGLWPASAADAERARAQDAARERVAGLARDIGDERPQDVLGFARAAVDAAAIEKGGEFAGIELVGIEDLQSERVDEPFGRLDFRVVDADVAGATAESESAAEFCFRVTFDYYGKVGEWSSVDGVQPVDCAPDVAAVVPPVDTTVREVVAVNARDAARTVLDQSTSAGEPADAEAIGAAIAALLDDPAGEYEVAVVPSVLVEPGASGTGDRIGVAMGRAEDCVLVKLEDGVVSDVRPAPVLLQPGELGCSPDTALADPERLRSPH